MANNFRERWQKNFYRWMRSRIKPEKEVKLTQKIIYILPSGSGMVFVIAIALIFIAAINYAVSLAFGLAFLMVSLFILSIFHTWNNLNRLSLSGLPATPVFCGDQIAFKVMLSREQGRTHETLELKFQEPPDAKHSHSDKAYSSFLNLINADRDEARVFAMARRRGYYPAPLLRVSTTFPLGLARAWSIVDLNMHCLVYPKPIPFQMEEFTSGSGGNDDSTVSKEGNEDFYGIREYVPGDPLRQVAWKNLAKGQGMQVKEFVDYVDSRIWLDWDMFYGYSIEERLSRLCYCVLQLAKKNAPYGLKMPGIEIAPGVGPGHRDKLLRALALYGVEQ